VHLYALGWGGFVALGALRQLSPVVFQSQPIEPTRWGRLGLLALVAGLAMFLFGLFRFRHPWTSVGGALMTLSFAMAFAAVVRSVGGKSRRSIVQWYVLPAAISLIATGIIGTSVAVHRAT